MSIRMLHSIFLIVGTAVGAGILALPISTASAGFWGSFISLTITWVFMTFAAFNLLKARLCYEEDVDLATMTTSMLGRSANIVVECCYLALLMALVSMYITVGSAWAEELLGKYLNLHITTQSAQIGFTVVIAGIIYSGIGNLANINQLITMAKLFFLAMIIIISFDQVNTTHLEAYALKEIPSTFSMLLTTFGFSIVLPSLTGYLGNNKRSIYAALIIGSLIILSVYLLWELITFGIIGQDGLAQIASAQDKGTMVINTLAKLVQNPSFNTYGLGIMLTAVLTSFLGVGHCLFSYLKDSLKIQNPGHKKRTAILLGFIPPVIIINIYPAGITSILSFAGIFVAIILGILPTFLVLSEEYQKKAEDLPVTKKAMAYISLAFFSYIILNELYNMLN